MIMLEHDIYSGSRGDWEIGSRCSARVRQSIEFRIKLRELIFPYRLEVSQSLSASTPG
jgi:hypothetical protein